MIKEKLLNNIFIKEKYYTIPNIHYIQLHAYKKNLNIYIVNDKYNSYITYCRAYFKRKNCLVFQDTPAKRVVSKSIYETSIIFNINFIKSIIRHKQLNCILNIE